LHLLVDYIFILSDLSFFWQSLILLYLSFPSLLSFLFLLVAELVHFDLVCEVVFNFSLKVHLVFLVFIETVVIEAVVKGIVEGFVLVQVLHQERGVVVRIFLVHADELVGLRKVRLI
jgi:hypothetical protein